MSAAARLLNRLDGVRETRPGRWRARCPAHGSRKRSVAIAQIEDRVLVHAFCGCGVDAVLAAVGLSTRDLFETSPASLQPLRRSPWSAADLLDLVLLEMHVVAIVAAYVLDKRTVNERDWARLTTATTRLATIARETGR